MDNELAAAIFEVAKAINRIAAAQEQNARVYADDIATTREQMRMERAESRIDEEE